MKLAIMGPPGSGKGTQAEILSKKYNLKHIYTGDLLREEKRRGTKLGKLIQSIIDKGNYMPSEIVIDLIKDKIPKDNFILDGSPRRIKEAEWVEELHPLDIFIHLEIDEETIMERLSKRRVCINCGELYHLATKKPKKENICDKCGNKLSIRADDKPEIIKYRLEMYKKESIPVVRFYEKNGKIKKIDAEGTIEEISKRILKVINEKRL
ncbi:MAG: nucleoside monophosphate kinase [Candidatus Nanoarchaeia archaeon]|nr:nucleoside monophosphate kinase [Candidatus Nanoarchaeia archaeon]